MAIIASAAIICNHSRVVDPVKLASVVHIIITLTATTLVDDFTTLLDVAFAAALESTTSATATNLSCHSRRWHTNQYLPRLSFAACQPCLLPLMEEEASTGEGCRIKIGLLPPKMLPQRRE
jgi:hypothetical protein